MPPAPGPLADTFARYRLLAYVADVCHPPDLVVRLLQTEDSTMSRTLFVLRYRNGEPELLDMELVREVLAPFATVGDDLTDGVLLRTTDGYEVDVDVNPVRIAVSRYPPGQFFHILAELVDRLGASVTPDGSAGDSPRGEGPGAPSCRSGKGCRRRGHDQLGPGALPLRLLTVGATAPITGMPASERRRPVSCPARVRTPSARRFKGSGMPVRTVASTSSRSSSWPRAAIASVGVQAPYERLARPSPPRQAPGRPCGPARRLPAAAR
ncbi:hypothetical protein GCM10009730_50690 [Streptomyces albidochromogenes]